MLDAVSVYRIKGIVEKSIIQSVWLERSVVAQIFARSCPSVFGARSSIALRPAAKPYLRSQVYFRRNRIQINKIFM